MRPSAPKTPSSRGAVGFVLKGYPRLSETFIAQEIRALEQRGLDIRIISLRHPTDRKRHPIHAEIVARVLYLPEYLWREPLRVLRGWCASRALPGYRGARAKFLRDLRRDLTPNRIRRFGQALVLASELPGDVTQLHAHFMHTPASVARYAALMRGLRWTLSAHAKDVWTTPAWEQREKLAECGWAVTCTEAGAAHLRALAPEPGRATLIYHGLDGARFPPPARRVGPLDGSDAADPVQLLSIGRAVAKKGFDDLLTALARLPRALAWRLTHIGGGPLLASLKQQAMALGVADRIRWLGAQAQETVLAAYREADLFVLASRVSADGDRDGLPNVLLEAQSQRLAVISTALPGIAELVEPEATGLLVPPGEPPALAAALERLIRDPQERARLGAAGESRVRSRFTLEAGIEQLAEKFGLEEAAEPCALRSMRR
ncbi:MAG TPA: glycosyltransferase family 4 protein [Stellaceae bacterium]|nr:glycosyltransferase family 4 protein [Stellaceae bacterium]